MTPNIINFGTIERSSEGEHRTFKIVRGDGGPLNPEIEPIKDNNIQVELKAITPGEEYELDVRAVPPWPTSAVQGYINFKTGVSESPEDKIRYYAQMAVRLRAAPNRIAVPPTPESDLNMRTRLLWSGGTPGKVTEVSVTDPQIKAQLIEERNQQFVDVIIPKGYQCSPRGSWVTVQTDDASAPELRIQLYPSQAQAVSTPTTRTQRPGGVGNQPTLRPRPSLGAKESQTPPGKTVPAAEQPTETVKEKPAETSDKPAAEKQPIKP